MVELHSGKQQVMNDQTAIGLKVDVRKIMLISLIIKNARLAY